MKPSTPKGVRDFTPAQVNRRNFIFNTIRKVFIKYGYQPIETPAMENLSTLTGKYGEEGDQLLFKVLNNGDFLKKADKEALDNLDSKKAVFSLSKRGLRYDLTVPFARFVVMHQNDIAFPFKRYQIQPVWRADRPQKGRYQEFYQCDVDVVGSDSLMYEAELLQIYDEVFANLGLEVRIKFSNRKILAAMAEVAGIPNQFSDMSVAIDKLDKIGMDGIRREMEKREIPTKAIDKIEEILKIDQLDALTSIFANSEVGQKGIAELKEIYQYFDLSTAKNQVSFDITLARGLSYYTGFIVEVEIMSKEVKMGSIGGGGRYDDLTGNFGLKDVSGVGISFGAARIYDVMEELQLFPATDAAELQVLLIALDEESHRFAFKALTKLRKANINADLYPSPAKMQKQIKYANKRNIPYTIVIGSSEMESGQLAFKNMVARTQEMLTVEEIINRLQ